MDSNIKLYVLAGGLGTRLRNITGPSPKALASINGTSLLELQMNNWRNQGLNNIVMLLGYGAKEIIDFLEAKKELINNLGLKVTYIIEHKKLGTGGALKNAIVNDYNNLYNFLCTNCDTWIPKGFEQMKSLDPNTVAIAKSMSRSDASFVHIRDNMIIKFYNQKKVSRINQYYINAGLYNLDVNTILEFKNDIFSLEKDLFPSLASKKKLKAKLLPCPIIDIGVDNRYKQFCTYMGQSSRTTNE